MSVVIAARDDLDPLIGTTPSRDAVDEPVLPGDATRPPTREIALERFRLAETEEWVTACILYQFIASQYIRIMAEPVKVVFPCERREVDIHRPDAGFASWRCRVAPELAAEQPFGIHRVGKQVHSLLPAGKLVFRQHHDVALAALARDNDRRAAFDGFVQIARQVLTQIPCM